MTFICQECGEPLESPNAKHTYDDCLRWKHSKQGQKLRRDMTVDELIKDLEGFRNRFESNNEWFNETLCEAVIRALGCQKKGEA